MKLRLRILQLCKSHLQHLKSQENADGSWTGYPGYQPTSSGTDAITGTAAEAMGAIGNNANAKFYCCCRCSPKGKGGGGAKSKS